MSNQCSNLFEYRSFSPFTSPLKPYPTTTLRPIFPFHNNLILNSRRSRSRTSSVRFPPLAAQSSSDIVLIATTEHQDGSFVFQFGDASEVVKNDEVVEEKESQAEPESNVVTVVDGDHERQVIVETIERANGSDGEKITEVADGIRTVDIDSDIARKDTKVISGLRDYHVETSENIPYISEEEVLSLQSDAQMNNSLEGVEGMLDNETECADQLDGDESLNQTISLLDNSPNRDKNATVLKDGDDEIEDPSVSVNLESMQVSHIEDMDVKQPYDEELHKVKREDTSDSDIEDVMPPTTMRVSDVELTDAAKEDAEERLQDMNINEDTLIEDMPPSNLEGEPILHEVEAILEVSSTKAMDVEDQGMEVDLQQVMPISDTEEVEPILEEELKPTMQVSDIEIQDSMNVDDEVLQVIDDTEDPSVYEDVEKGSQDMSVNEGVLIDGMLLSDPLGDESTTLDEVSQLQSTPVKLEETMEVSTSKRIDDKDQAVEDELQQGITNYNDENVVAPAEPILEEEVCQLQSTPMMRMMFHMSCNQNQF